MAPPGFWRSLRDNRRLVAQMTRREIVGRYQGSIAGVLWSVINPLFMLVIYAFVFSVVFKARWGGGDATQSHAQFGLILFTGLIVHNFVAECLMRAPRLVLDHSNYVKRVVFPLEILPLMVVAAALFQACVSYLVLVAGLFVLNGGVPPTALLLPLVLLPAAIGTLGLVWLLASLGVFARDIQQLVGMLVTASLFLTPIFFPASALPERFQTWIFMNPLTLFVEQSRDVLIWGRMPGWPALGLAYLVAVLVACMGYAWFQKTRKGFADVL